MAGDQTWSLLDSDERPVMIVQRGADVLIDVGLRPLPVGLRFDGVRRDLFIRCFMEAERRAEANAAGVPDGE